jgi:hypothetical protein
MRPTYTSLRVSFPLRPHTAAIFLKDILTDLEIEETMQNVKKPYRVIFDGGVVYEGEDAAKIAEFKQYAEKNGIDISDPD